MTKQIGNCGCSEKYCVYCQCSVDPSKSVPKYSVWVDYKYAQPTDPRVEIEVKGKATWGPNELCWTTPTHWRIKE